MKKEVIECFKLSSINLNYESDRFVGLIGDQVLERPLCFRFLSCEPLALPRVYSQ